MPPIKHTYKVITDSYATGTNEHTFNTLQEAETYAKNIYGGAWFDIKILKDNKVINENIFGIGWTNPIGE